MNYNQKLFSLANLINNLRNYFFLKLRFKSFGDIKPSLTLVGVGPGDPSLITIAAIKAIRKATVIAYPVSQLGGKSMAAEIAGDWIKGKRTMPLVFPMTLDGDSLDQHWKIASEKLSNAIQTGENVVFISQGDPSLYSTCCYVLIYLKSHYPECTLKIIPGVNSFSAAAAAGQWPLSLQKEALFVSPVPEEPKDFENLLDESLRKGLVLVLLKLGFRWEWVRPILEKKGLLDKTLFVKKVGFFDQEISKAENVSKDSKPYFSLLIVRPHWPSIK
ncbi:precorrin-2 C(20)-methyltransferase [Prochlorococcus marinus]|uniref:Precorrin-2 C20-methyltransferase n=1 Tax=Prochlorococcus marinus (strain MIT 9211) TaxID=93059 RepID=A9BE06_PROM4|nr:precorrin-2 C(20)-methyltransferase [Prochlorococcus marinus]ABX08316.1 precorrin-2 C20-methyltransferase [Prochlorococcus marinus str. MIT 9211]